MHSCPSARHGNVPGGEPPSGNAWAATARHAQFGSHYGLRRKMGKHKRSQTSESERELKRIALSLDTLLRKRFGLPIDPNLQNPQPVSTERCLEFLRDVISSTSSSGVTEVMSPNHGASSR